MNRLQGWALALGVVAAGGLGMGLSGCDQPQATVAIGAAEFSSSASCSLDGMLLADYPGPKGQILYEGADGPEWFCDTLEVLDQLIRPEQVRKLKGAWVQDMAATDWDKPRGGWIDARRAIYVIGSSKKGAMGKTAASFKDAAAAQAFVAQHGGQALPFDKITPQMVDLSGGALHDSRM